MANPIAVDFETFFSAKLKYGLKQMIAEQYCSHDLFDCYLLSVSDGETTWAGHPKDFNWSALEGRTLLSHNSRFDKTVYEELCRRKLAPKLNIPEWHCTASLSSYLCNRRSLQDSVEHLLHHRVSKEYRGVADGKHWPQDYKPEEQEQVLSAGRSDALWCWRLFDRFGPQWPQVERDLSRITVDQGMRGVAIDTEKLDEYIWQTHEMLMNTEKVIPWIAGAEDDDWEGFKTRPTSTKCIAEQCRKTHIPCAPVKSEDEEAYVAWETKWGPANPWIQAVGSWRSINRLYQTFLVMKSRIRADGTLPFGLKYFGAHCVTGETEVLTQTGWVRIDQWNGGKIAQWDRSGKIQFLQAEPNKFLTDEPLKRFDAPYFKGEFTSGHTMPYWTHETRKFKTCQAGAFGTGKSRWVPIGGVLAEDTPSIFPDEMRVLVATQADGHWQLGPKEGGGLQFVLRKPRKIERIKTLLAGFSIPFQEDHFPSCPGQTSIRILKRDLPAWLTPERKVFGPWLLAAAFESRLAFLSELFFWDGYRKTQEYYSSVRQNVEWAALMAHLTGAAMAVREKPQRGNRRRHWAGVLRRTQTALVFSEPHISEIAGEARSVYCPTTQTGFWMFRHRGSIGVTGNTGRWAGDSKVNMQNQRKRPIVCNEFGLLELNDKRVDAGLDELSETGKKPEWMRYIIDFRSLIIPRPGKKMIVSDLSQIEPRVLAWLTGNWDFLKRVAAGDSPYVAHARASMGFVGDKMDKNSDLYKLAKARILGLGYQCGWEKFITMAQDLAGYDVTKDDPEWIEEEQPFTGKIKKVSGYGFNSKRIVQEFRDQNPKITDLWKQLGNAFKGSVGGDFVMALPNGRKMRYERVRASVRIEKDPETGKPKRVNVFTADTDGRHHAFYGGKLTENLVQAVARDAFGEQVARMVKGGWDCLFTVHDEAVLEVDPSVTAREVEHEMSYCPDWLKGCPVAAEAKEVSHYLK